METDRAHVYGGVWVDKPTLHPSYLTLRWCVHNRNSTATTCDNSSIRYIREACMWTKFSLGVIYLKFLSLILLSGLFLRTLLHRLRLPRDTPLFRVPGYICMYITKLIISTSELWYWYWWLLLFWSDGDDLWIHVTFGRRCDWIWDLFQIRNRFLSYILMLIIR